MTSDEKIALVTGSNKGIGFEAVRQFARRGVKTVLTARTPENGEKARQMLAEEGLEVDFHPLDVTQPESIRNLADWLSERYGRLDILVNNAGIYLDDDTDAAGVSVETLRQTLETNTYGPLRVTQGLLPLLKKSGSARVINVSSGYGQLHDMEGGPPAAYKISKTALNAVTRCLAGDLSPFGITVNAICPGWVRTDMGGPEAARSPEEGARGIVDLALKESGMPTGRFFRDLQPLDW